MCKDNLPDGEPGADWLTRNSEVMRLLTCCWLLFGVVITSVSGTDSGIGLLSRERLSGVNAPLTWLGDVGADLEDKKYKF